MKKWAFPFISLSILLVNSISFSMDLTDPDQKAQNQERVDQSEFDQQSCEKYKDNLAEYAYEAARQATRETLYNYHISMISALQNGDVPCMAKLGMNSETRRIRPSDLEEYRENEMLTCVETPEELDRDLVRIILKHAPDDIKKVLGSIWNEQRTMCAKILFVGEPGTGKTTLAVAIAQALRDKIACKNKTLDEQNKERVKQGSKPLKPLKFDYKLIDTPQLAGEVQNSGERNIKRAFSEVVKTPA